VHISLVVETDKGEGEVLRTIEVILKYTIRSAMPLGGYAITA
jgi:hypothetical protein